MRWKSILGGAIPAALACLGIAAPAASATADPRPPGLVVVIVIDQFSGDLFSQYRSRYHEGLKRLSSGIVYPNAYHAHGITETCAGHSVVLSGRYPSGTGIVSNEWYDGKVGAARYCTGDGVNTDVGGTRPGGVGPGLLEVSTLGDWLHAVRPYARVYTVAGKDRAAIMLGGHTPDGAFWFDGRNSFDTWAPTVQQAQERIRMLAHANAELARKLANGPPVWRYYDKTCRAFEHDVPLSSGRVLHPRLPPPPPDPIPGQTGKSGPHPPPWFYDEVTLDAAYDLIVGGKLGQRAGTDLLGIGLSGTDMVGHAYGTQGPEMCDHMARLDAMLGGFLDRAVAISSNTLFVVTADHGGMDFPERQAMRGYPAVHRLDSRKFLDDLNRTVQHDTGIDWQPLRMAFIDPSRLWLVGADGKTLNDESLRARILDSALQVLRRTQGVVQAWPATVLAEHRHDSAVMPDLMSLQERMALSMYGDRSGDLLIAFDPQVTVFPALPGLILEGHSAPYDFDRRVPLLFWGRGVSAEERAYPVRVVDLAPTLARLIGIEPAADTDGRCLNIIKSRPCP